jgi:hypothetical protein
MKARFRRLTRIPAVTRIGGQDHAIALAQERRDDEEAVPESGPRCPEKARP